MHTNFIFTYKNDIYILFKSRVTFTLKQYVHGNQNVSEPLNRDIL